MSSDLQIVSVSGGKDSTALYCWAIDRFGKDGFVAVFADTQHEHPVTYNYIRNLPEMAGGPPIHWVRSDFSEKLRQKGLEPSGSVYLDLMLWKGRTPGVKSQFCTEKLKLEPVKAWMEEIRGDREVYNYIGVRAQESKRRATLPERNFAELYEYVGCLRMTLTHIPLTLLLRFWASPPGRSLRGSLFVRS